MLFENDLVGENREDNLNLLVDEQGCSMDSKMPSSQLLRFVVKTSKNVQPSHSDCGKKKEEKRIAYNRSHLDYLYTQEMRHKY